ncbi:hypothetical protein B9Y60_10615 [Stenotrophomonas maltophilia]|nr:hypothetical protein B9Y73_10615 [Stenotrophomonas maltophilia]PJL55128.1 hypothetical protein B9Y60_10615 [Stenotrophomonas maltophilia]
MSFLDLLFNAGGVDSFSSGNLQSQHIFKQLIFLSVVIFDIDTLILFFLLNDGFQDDEDILHQVVSTPFPEVFTLLGIGLSCLSVVS